MLANSHQCKFLLAENGAYAYKGDVFRMDFCFELSSTMSFRLLIRGVEVPPNLCISKLLRKSQYEELSRQLKSDYAILNKECLDFNDRQNHLLVINKRAGRCDAFDLCFALRLISVSRSAYIELRKTLALPSIRFLQNTFSSCQSVSLDNIFSSLSEIQRMVHLIIDEIYVKPALRFTAGQIYGYAEDSQELAKTILVVFAKCDY